MTAREKVAAEIEQILALANELSTRLKGTPEMYTANKILHAGWAIQAALADVRKARRWTDE